jgi:nucleoside-diphosphate-sugar epimerase
MHLAGIHSLRLKDADGSIWKTNVDGTHNVLEFCVRNDISRLFFTSTAYTWPVNPYGCSKIRNEEEISQFVQKHGLKVTIFKPSIVMGSEHHPYPGHFAQFIMGLVKMNKRVESVRRRVEGVLRLPILEPAFRIKGNAEGSLNLVPIDAVAQAITEIEEEGTFWLTNPQPPKIGDLAEWVGEVIRMRLYIQRDFRANPIEAMFRRKARAFLPYLWGDSFISDLTECQKIDKEFIQNTAKALIA